MRTTYETSESQRGHVTVSKREGPALGLDGRVAGLAVIVKTDELRGRQHLLALWREARAALLADWPEVSA